ncbi:MAG: hypothetical protein ACFBSG_17725 [Leptolyngbyaceae cyanobacterium]
MWQSALNYLQSLRTYRDLGPDTKIRRRINLQLNGRSSLSLEEWSKLFVSETEQPPAESLLAFIYEKLPAYSGLKVSQLRPSDRLIEDLQLPLVCWFDWPTQLCIDFYETFQVDISEEFDESMLETIGELVFFLNERIISCDPTTSS